jgi:NAD(P)-dependent dehydrogenase (short-subunit alcohol dehydrogenase family)
VASAGSAARDLHGRVAPVTGAGSGIGRATSLLMAEAGAYVVAAGLDQRAAAATASAAAVTPGHRGWLGGSRGSRRP